MGVYGESWVTVIGKLRDLMGNKADTAADAHSSIDRKNNNNN